MENLMFGLGVALLGICVVFVGLVILIGFIKLLSVGNQLFDGKKKKEAPAKAETPAAPVAEPAAVQAAEEGISPEIIAAITAAIASVWDGEGGFVVRHVKRIHNAPAWNRAGREEQTYSRF